MNELDNSEKLETENRQKGISQIRMVYLYNGFDEINGNYNLEVHY